MKHKTGVAKYLGACIFGGFLTYLVVSLRDFDDASVKERFLILADAFTIPGVILLCIGILVALSNKGIFLGFSYAIKYVYRMLVPGVSKDHETYGDYVEQQREKGKASGFGFLFFTGLAFLLIAVVFIVLFYRW